MSEDTPLVPLSEDRAIDPDRREIFGQVIDLAGVMLQRGRTPWGAKKCEHKRLTFCSTERRVWCLDCERTVDGFDAFMVLASSFEKMMLEAKGNLRKANDALNSTARLRATKVIDKAWSGNVMAICCPHCSGGLLPEDFVSGGSQMSRELEIARRRKKAEKKDAANV